MKIINLAFIILVCIAGWLLWDSFETEGPNWRRLYTGPMVARDMKIYIDRNSIVDGKWDDTDGRFCWVKITDVEDGTEVALEYRAFFDKEKSFAVITECKENVPEFTGKNLMVTARLGERGQRQPDLSEEYVFWLVDRPWGFGTLDLGNTFSPTIMALHAEIVDIVWDKR